MFIKLDKDPVQRRVQILIAFTLLLCFSLWLSVRETQSRWINVPPLPSRLSVAASSLSDSSFAYRSIGLMLQNLGDVGGRTTSLRDYDTARLKDWFMLQNALDPRSNFTPGLAAYYFGGIEDSPQHLNPLIDYLEFVGNDPQGEKWRWLAQAVFISRFRAKDMDRALILAKELAALADKNPHIPIWARQMPALVLTAKGDKEAARFILLSILKSNAEGKIKLEQAEINATVDIICNRTMSKAEAQSLDLCKNLK